MLFNLIIPPRKPSASVLVGLPHFRPTFAEQWKSCRFNMLPQLSVLDHIKHATRVTKFIQFMFLDLLRILQQTSATSSRVTVP